MNLKEQVLYTQVRVKVKTEEGQVGGSGTVIHSGIADKGFSTYVLTCHHVIQKALTVKKEYDHRIGRDRKELFKQVATVEFFDFESVPHGRRPISSSVDGVIMAYDKPHDMALLKLRRITQAPHIAKLYPEERIEEIEYGDKTYAVGCALLHDPILTEGMITHMGDEIDYKDYWMSSAQIIFGNSGGAMFTPCDGEFMFIGVPSRIDIAGWSDPITHLGYFSPINRVYEFLREQHFEFIFDSNFTEEGCKKTRDKIRKEAEKYYLPAEVVED